RLGRRHAAHRNPEPLLHPGLAPRSAPHPAPRRSQRGRLQQYPRLHPRPHRALHGLTLLQRRRTRSRRRTGLGSAARKEPSMFKPLLLLALATGASLALPAGAQETASITQEGSSLRFEAAGHRITLPFPDWLTAAERLAPDVVALVESNTYSDPKQAFVEFFPRGQSLENYETTYAARITREPGRSLEDYRRTTIFGYSQGCKPE